MIEIEYEDEVIKHMKRNGVFLVILCAIMTLMGCENIPYNTSGTIIAEVGNYTIYENDVWLIKEYLNILKDEQYNSIVNLDIEDITKETMLHSLDILELDEEYVLTRLIEDKKLVSIAENLGIAAANTEVDDYISEYDNLYRYNSDATSLKFMEIVGMNRKEFKQWHRLQVYDYISISKLREKLSEKEIMDEIQHIRVTVMDKH